MTYIVQDRQNLIDIAVQNFGTALAVFELAQANNISVTEKLVVGQKIFIPESVTHQQKEIINYYKKHNLTPTTSEDIEGAPNGDGAGIGYMQIGTTFKVS